MHAKSQNSEIKEGYPYKEGKQARDEIIRARFKELRLLGMRASRAIEQITYSAENREWNLEYKTIEQIVHGRE